MGNFKGVILFYKNIFNNGFLMVEVMKFIY